MSNNEKRSNLRGLESSIFDLVGTGATTEQWAEWLKVPLQHAAAAGDLRLVTKLQRAGANGNVLNAFLRGGQAALARDMVTAGASVIGQDEHGDTPLHLAAALGDEDTVSLMLQKGAPPDTLDGAGRRPLHLAASKGRLTAVNVLLAAGAVFKHEALNVAAAEGHVEIVTALIRSGVNVNTPDSTGSTALHKAACNNGAGVIDVLVEAGAAVGAAEEVRGWMPLHSACGSVECCFEAVVALLENGARVNELGRYRESPLHLAVTQGHLPVTEFLVKAGADVNVTDDLRSTALRMAAVHGHEEVSTVLVLAGADVDATGYRGRTALHDAVAFNSSAGTIRLLIRAGAAVDALDEDGMTPLLVLCQTWIACSLKLMAALLEGGANPNARDLSGNVPLRWAACEDWTGVLGDAVDLLLRWGADEMATTDEGRPILEEFKAKYAVNSRMWHLLTQAPFNRNWRRRGWLLLYRAYPRRMVPIPDTGAAPSDRVSKCRIRSISTEATGGARVVSGEAAGAVAGGGASATGDWSDVVTWVVRMELEGVFRNIVGYL